MSDSDTEQGSPSPPPQKPSRPQSAKLNNKDPTAGRARPASAPRAPGARTPAAATDANRSKAPPAQRRLHTTLNQASHSPSPPKDPLSRSAPAQTGRPDSARSDKDPLSASVPGKAGRRLRKEDLLEGVATGLPSRGLTLWKQKPNVHRQKLGVMARDGLFSGRSIHGAFNASVVNSRPLARVGGGLGGGAGGGVDLRGLVRGVVAAVARLEQQVVEIERFELAAPRVDVSGAFFDVLGQVVPSLTQDEVRQLVRELGQAGGSPLAIDAFHWIGAHHLYPTHIDTYNELIQTCQRCRDFAAAHQLFASLEEKEIAPDIVTYNMMLDMCVAQRDHETAFQLFDRMKQQPVQPNTFTYTALIQTCIPKAGSLAFHWQDALRVFSEMQLAGAYHAEVDTVALRDLVRVCCGAIGQAPLPQALTIWRSMARASVGNTAGVYGALLDACVRHEGSEAAHPGEGLQQALDLFQAMHAEGMEPEVEVYNLVLKAAERAGDVEVALQVLGSVIEARTQARVDLVPTTQTFDILVRMCLRADKLEAALEHCYGDFLRATQEGGASAIEALRTMPVSAPAFDDAISMALRWHPQSQREYGPLKVLLLLLPVLIPVNAATQMQQRRERAAAAAAGAAGAEGAGRGRRARHASEDPDSSLSANSAIRQQKLNAMMHSGKYIHTKAGQEELEEEAAQAGRVSPEPERRSSARSSRRGYSNRSRPPSSQTTPKTPLGTVQKAMQEQAALRSGSPRAREDWQPSTSSRRGPPSMAQYPVDGGRWVSQLVRAGAAHLPRVGHTVCGDSGQGGQHTAASASRLILGLANRHAHPPQYLDDVY